jgi:hypothetical protein
MRLILMWLMLFIGLIGRFFEIFTHFWNAICCIRGSLQMSLSNFSESCLDFFSLASDQCNK